jgi:hypothetical protein
MAFIIGMLFGAGASNSKLENFIFGCFLLMCALGIIFMGFLFWLLKMIIFAFGGILLAGAVLALLWFFGKKGMRSPVGLCLFIVLFIGAEILKRNYL